MDFETLRSERQVLNNAVLRHEASVLYFRAEDWAWFKLTADEGVDDSDATSVRHLSTSASCIESLFDSSLHGAPDVLDVDLPALANTFASRALDRNNWQSDRAAEVYCRVRTLPVILRQSNVATLKPYADVIKRHVMKVWNQLVPENPEAQGIAERTTSSKSTQVGQQYPPNAFHTYWALRLASEYLRRGSDLGLQPLPSTFTVKRAVALLWCNRTLAAQTALVEAEADRLDAQQLAWALLADYEGTQFGTDDPAEPTTTTNERRELYEAGLAAFFSEQSSESGAWPLYQPLFHYPGAGNAYCYTFETLTALLRPALLREEGRLLRDLLYPHLPSLIRARELAEQTAIPLPGGGQGWSSGHHPHRQQPEAWATASVLSYMQALRRLVGYWTSEAARRELACRKPKYVDPEEAKINLRERGNTWTDDPKRLNVARELAGLFVHPRLASQSDRTDIEPDAALVGSTEARSAILFGPPGTGKTTLVEAVAGAIDWDFVEVPASAFVSEGIDRVPAKAELIFTELMELDRTVILFDEVDELIRERTRKDSDALGRFLTTSMLPKLAKLWDQRRVLFFMATNSVDIADPAIRRSQRFDASIFVAPPSFTKKQERFREALKAEPPPELTYSIVNEAVQAQKLPEAEEGTFALLRWDQIPELAGRMRDSGQVSFVNLQKVLRKMGDELSRLEYHDDDDSNDVFEVWRKYWGDARRDYGRSIVIRIDDPPSPVPEHWPKVGKGSDNSVYLDLGALGLENLVMDPEDDGCSLTLDGKTFRDHGALDFSET